MKKTILSLLLATSIFSSANALTDFSKGTNYYLIYLDKYSVSNINESDVKKDYRVDDVTHFLYVWEQTYIDLGASGANSNGFTGEFLHLKVAPGKTWSGFGISCPMTDPLIADFDCTEITSDYIFHIALKAPVNNTETHCIALEGGIGRYARASIGTTKFIDGTKNADIFCDFPRDNQWHEIEIPMSFFFSRGLSYPYHFTDNIFSFLSGKTGSPAKEISIDAVYIYQKKQLTSVDNTKENNFDLKIVDDIISINTNDIIELYNIDGVIIKTSNTGLLSVKDISKGVYVVKSGNVSKKIIIN